MDLLARHFALRRCIALVLAATVTAACATWRTVRAGPEAMIARPPQSVRVELVHGGTQVLHAATLTRTQLVGYRTERDTATRVTIPLREVSSIQVRGAEPRGTATNQSVWTEGTVLALTVGFLAIVALGASSLHFGGALPIGKL